MKLKQWKDIFHVIANAKSIVQVAIRIRNGITEPVNVNVKVIVRAKNIIFGILAHVFVRMASIKSIADTSVVNYDEIITVLDIVSTKVTNTIATYVRSTASINRHCKKVKDCYILRTVLLVIILLLIVIIICYHYAKQKFINH